MAVEFGWEGSLLLNELNAVWGFQARGGLSPFDLALLRPAC